jgi:hypothetical protein
MTIKNSELAEMFAKGGEGKLNGSHMFIEGDTIYSYGYHFPIAKRFDAGRFIFTTSGYSVSTSIHKGHVRRALNGKELIFLPKCDVNQSIEQKGRNEKEIAEIKDKLKRVRTENSRMHYEDRIIELRRQNELLDDIIPNIIAEKL